MFVERKVSQRIERDFYLNCSKHNDDNANSKQVAINKFIYAIYTALQAYVPFI